MKTLALFVVAGVMLLALAIAILVYEPDAESWAEYMGFVGSAIAAAAVLASIIFQVREDARAPSID